MNLTLIVPFYRNCKMLERHLQEWEHYPEEVTITVVDDGSPEPAEPILAKASTGLRERLRLYRITVDKPWNREGARNLASREADTDWLVHVDIDHILPAEACQRLVCFQPDPLRWYRFPRFRVGKADETRKKDAISPDDAFGAIKPHIDSYLISKALYWSIGGYDEDYVGVLGGGCAFLRRLESKARVPVLLPEPICLHVYTRDVVDDASVLTLSRDTAKGKEIERRKLMMNDMVPKNPIRFPWVRVL